MYDKLRKGLMISLLGALMTLALLPVQAQSTDDLSDLARYVPAEYTVYASIQIDDNTIATLDGVLARIASAFGEDNPTSLTNARDEIFNVITRGGGWSDVEDWIGDSVVIAGTVEGFQRDSRDFIEDGEAVPLMVLFPVRDGADTSALMDEMGERLNFTRETMGDFTVFSNEIGANNLTVLFGDDVVILRPYVIKDTALIPESGASLADSAEFIETLAQLPADDYGAMVYLDIMREIAPVVAREMSDSERDMMQSFNMDIPATLEALGTQAIGATLLEGNTLAIDIATRVRDVDVLAGMGMMMEIGQPVNLDFLANVPIESAFTILGNDFGTQLLTGIDRSLAQLELLDTVLAEAGVSLNDEEVGGRALDDLANFALLAYQGMAGISVQETFEWMTGDIAFAFSPFIGDRGFRFDQATILENTDATRADATLEAIQNLLTELGVVSVMDDNGMLRVSELRELFELIQSGGDPELQGIDPAMFEFVGIATDDLALSGTLPAVMRVLSLQDSLLDSEAFARARSTFLPDTGTLFFINLPALRPVVSNLPEGRDALQQVLAVFESASITANYTDAGRGVARLSLTLAP